jgi:hypothetical protein
MPTVRSKAQHSLLSRVTSPKVTMTASKGHAHDNTPES